MRIIAGGLRGRRIRTAREPGLRPISGRIKQSLFDIIAGLVPGARFLDLFAGTGSVGLEALSRGAGFVFFVDSNRRCVEALSRILEGMGLAGRARVQRGDALGDLSWIPFRAGVPDFNLVFLGPPYKDDQKRPLAYTTPALRRVAEAGLLVPGGLLIAQHHVKEEVEPPEGFRLSRREKYGDTYLSFLRPAGSG